MLDTPLISRRADHTLLHRATADSPGRAAAHTRDGAAADAADLAIPEPALREIPATIEQPSADGAEG